MGRFIVGSWSTAQLKKYRYGRPHLAFSPPLSEDKVDILSNAAEAYGLSPAELISFRAIAPSLRESHYELIASSKQSDLTRLLVKSFANMRADTRFSEDFPANQLHSVFPSVNGNIAATEEGYAFLPKMKESAKDKYQGKNANKEPEDRDYLEMTMEDAYRLAALALLDPLTAPPENEIRLEGSPYARRLLQRAITDLNDFLPKNEQRIMTNITNSFWNWMELPGESRADAVNGAKAYENVFGESPMKPKKGFRNIFSRQGASLPALAPGFSNQTAAQVEQSIHDTVAQALMDNPPENTADSHVKAFIAMADGKLLDAEGKVLPEPTEQQRIDAMSDNDPLSIEMRTLALQNAMEAYPRLAEAPDVDGMIHDARIRQLQSFCDENQTPSDSVEPAETEAAPTNEWNEDILVAGIAAQCAEAFGEREQTTTMESDELREKALNVDWTEDRFSHEQIINYKNWVASIDDAVSAEHTGAGEELVEIHADAESIAEVEMDTTREAGEPATEALVAEQTPAQPESVTIAEAADPETHAAEAEVVEEQVVQQSIKGLFDNASDRLYLAQLYDTIRNIACSTPKLFENQPIQSLENFVLALPSHETLKDSNKMVVALAHMMEKRGLAKLATDEHGNTSFSRIATFQPRSTFFNSAAEEVLGSSNIWVGRGISKMSELLQGRLGVDPDLADVAAEGILDQMEHQGWLQLDADKNIVNISTEILQVPVLQKAFANAAKVVVPDLTLKVEEDAAIDDDARNAIEGASSRPTRLRQPQEQQSPIPMFAETRVQATVTFSPTWSEFHAPKVAAQ